MGSSSTNRRRRQYCFLMVAIFGLALYASSFGAQSFQLRGDPQAGWGTEEWRLWRDQQINYILEPTFPHGNKKLILREDVIKRAGAAYELLRPLLKAQPDYFSKNPELSRAMGHFVGFISAQSWMVMTGGDTHRLGLSITDVEYWPYAAPYVIFPPLLRSQDFLTDMETPDTYKRAVDMIERQNQDLPADQKWIVLPFLAQFIKSVDGKTWGRMLVLVPNVPVSGGGIVDEWVLFSIATPDQHPLPSVESVSIISIYRNGSITKSYPVDFVRRKDASGVYHITPTVLLPDRPSHNCYDCHKAAILSIRPELEYTFDSEGHLVAKNYGRRSHTR